jgi:hypothetical protein
MRRLLSHWPVITLALLSVILMVTNYTPGTYLSGWDTLHPEFNYWLNLKRVLFGVFREEQGLGAVAAHAHMAELPRILLLFLFDLFLPTSMVRYCYFFLTLLAGPIGMYLFLSKVIFTEKKSETQHNYQTPSHKSNLALQLYSNTLPSFLGAVFYLLNLGTLQQFIVPFEMFTTLYATLPFLMLWATKYVTQQNGPDKHKLLLVFTFTTLLAAPSAYAPTLWYVHFGLFTVYLLLFCTLQKNQKRALKRAAMLLLLSLSLNAFWILPSLYFLLTHSSEVSNAYINKLFSPQAFLYNKQFGTLSDIALLKSFLFDWSIYEKNHGFINVLQIWNIHLAKPGVLLIGYTAACIASLGFLTTTLRRDRQLFALLPVLGIVLFFLVNQNGPTAALYTTLLERMPILKEALRFPHTKLYIHYIFFFAVFFAAGLEQLFRLIHKVIGEYTRILLPTLALGIVLSLSYTMAPAFSGNFIHPLMRISYPKAYFELFQFMNAQQDTGRVAQLPIHSFWGWEYYDWSLDSVQDKPSFQGAGFLWFGMKQPILVRDFDRWNSTNESYYREMSQAVYSQNAQLFHEVIRKYAISYLLVDSSMIAPYTDEKVLFYPELERLIAQQSDIKELQTFGLFLTVYKVTNPTQTALITDAVPVATESKTQHIDAAKILLHEYYRPTKNDSSAIRFPFANISNNDGYIPPDKLSISDEGVAVRMPDKRQDTVIATGSMLEGSTFLPADMYVRRTDNNLSISFYISLFGTDRTDILPLTTTVTLPVGIQQAILSINRTQSFLIPSFPDATDRLVGRVQLRTDIPNTLALFNQTANETVKPNFTSLSYTLGQCDMAHTDQGFGIHELQNGFILTGQRTTLCLYIPFTELFSETNVSHASEFLVTGRLSINSSANTSHQTTLCTALANTNECLDSGSMQALLSPQMTDSYTPIFGLQGATLATGGIRVFMDATHTQTPISVTYSNLTFGLHEPLYATSFAAETLNQALRLQPNQLSQQRILFPFTGSPFSQTDITTLPRGRGDCEQNPQTSQNTATSVSEIKQRYIRYNATDGLTCDRFTYTNLSADTGYILLIRTRTISGLPLTVCATNRFSKRCDAYTRLPEKSEFTTHAILLPPLGETQRGYDINISNLGIRGTPAVNDLAAMSLVPIPYHWLNSIRETPDAGQRLIPSVQSVQTDHQSPSQYQLAITNIRNNSLLMLPVSFDAGFSAYQIDSPLATLLPTVFGKKLKNHVTVNSWANGWFIPAEQKATISIMYIPQYLEFFGLLLLCLSLWHILFPLRRASKNRQQT